MHLPQQKIAVYSSEMKTFCGPTLSGCGIILSIWGIVQLGVMGALFYVQSVNLIEDVPVHNMTEYMENPHHVTEAYHQQAYNSWVCAGLYVLLLAISAQQMWLNIKPVPYTGM